MPQIPIKIQPLTKEFKRLQKQKYSKSGNVEARVLTNICHAAGEISAFVRGGTLRLDPEADNLVNLNINLIGQRKRKLEGRLSAITPKFGAKPDKREPRALAQASVVESVIQATDQKVDQPSRTGEILDWLMLGGVAVEYIPWIPDTSIEPVPMRDETGLLLFEDLAETQDPNDPVLVNEMEMEELLGLGRVPESFEIHTELRPIGDLDSQIFGPLNIFVDHTVTDIEKLPPDMSFNIARIRTVDWVKENYSETAEEAEFDLDKLKPNEDIRIVLTNLSHMGDSRSGINIRRLIPAIQGTPGDDDPDMVVVVDRFQDRSKANPEGRYTTFIPSQGVLRNVDLTQDYEDGIPVVAYHWSRPTTTFWTKDYVSNLIPLNRAISRAISDQREYYNGVSHLPMLLGSQLKKEDLDPADVFRMVENGVSPDGIQQVQFPQSPPLPQGWNQHLETMLQLFNDLAGSSDLFRENKFPGNLRGSMGFPVLQEILDTEWGPFFMHFGERLARAKQKRVNRMKQHYEGVRVLNYVGRDKRDEVIEFKASDILRSGTEFNITIDVKSLLPELRALREERIANRMRNFPMIYQDDRSPGMWDKTKIAQDLQIGDVDREDHEAQMRKLASEIVGRLNDGKPIPQMLPWWQEAPMLDELEREMNTTEWLFGTSPEVQQAFTELWQQLQESLAQKSQAAQQAQQQQDVDAIVAQAAQQAAAKAAADTVDLAVQQALEGLRQLAAQGINLSELLLRQTGDVQ